MLALYDEGTLRDALGSGWYDRLKEIVDVREREVERFRSSSKGQVLERQRTKWTDIDVSSGATVPVEALRRGVAFPRGTDARRREDYLGDEEFRRVFNMGREEWRTLGSWKRGELKKEVGLF
mmetsp:Transcript_7531/g.14907  ORF Transcript_7531/g.14907 Transcript_7531/m.14907 type:complete len:122 (+) Transcript_7531:505-870(+)